MYLEQECVVRKILKIMSIILFALTFRTAFCNVDYFVSASIDGGHKMNDLSVLYVQFKHLRDKRRIATIDLAVKPSEGKKKGIFNNFCQGDKVEVEYFIEHLAITPLSDTERDKILSYWIRTTELDITYPSAVKFLNNKFASHAKRITMLLENPYALWSEDMPRDKKEMYAQCSFTVNDRQDSAILYEHNNVYFD
jgi:hypothetical protein